ncbi:colicin E5-related ribonuclease [Salinicola sp. CPA57]|uniref:colicin E5-related ribonuclease n=1 Tax=Salinicola sp. CPA57 TaxID=1949080 RepID=UPI001300B76D|nr:colicin E5-related ribonuclease [Salinicola sp. CPA57]
MEPRSQPCRTRLRGGVAGAVFTGDAKGAYSGADSGERVYRYNALAHDQLVAAAKELNHCETKTQCKPEAIYERYLRLSAEQNREAIEACRTDPNRCAALSRVFQEATVRLDEVYGQYNGGKRYLLDRLIDENIGVQEQLAEVTTRRQANIYASAVLKALGLPSSRKAVITDGLVTVVTAMGVVGPGKRGVSVKAPIVIEGKIYKQMGKRGWSIDSIKEAIAKPSKTVATKDTRFDPATNKRLNDPATGYITKDGSYVVQNDRTGAIVQISNRNNKKWNSPWEENHD